MPILEAPSGLVVEMRKMRGAEVVALAERADDAGAGKFGAIVGPCWVRTVDPGPYSFVLEGDAKPPFDRMLTGDMLAAFVFLRRISMPDGNHYDFEVRCERCGKGYGWRVRLDEHLRTQPLPAASVERLRRGEAMETHVDGRAVRFHLQTIGHETLVEKMLRKQKRQVATIVDLLAARIVSVEGLKPGEAARWDWVSDLAIDDLYGLRDAMDEQDCGLDTLLRTACEARDCRWEQDVVLPLGGSFFLPKRRPRPAPPAPEPSSSEDSSGDSAASTSGPSSTTSSGPSTAAAATA